MYTYFSADRGS